MPNDYHQFYSTIDGAKSVLLITHRRPDGDACGSLLALAGYLKNRGLEVGAFISDQPPTFFDFLPLRQIISSDHTLIERSWDLAIVVDAGSWEHTGLPVADLTDLTRRANVMVIDHHQTNTRYGKINIVAENLSSTCELLFQIFTTGQVLIDRQLATCLLSGILTDTGIFTNSATSDSALAAAADLVRTGASMHQIVDHVLRNKSLAALRLWGLVLSRLTVNKKINTVITYVTDDDFRQFNVDQEVIDGISGLLQVITGHNCTVLCVITGNQTKVSLRTTHDHIDVSEVAKLFGGGGHRKAAGFTVPFRLDPSRLLG